MNPIAKRAVIVVAASWLVYWCAQAAQEGLAEFDMHLFLIKGVLPVIIMVGLFWVLTARQIQIPSAQMHPTGQAVNLHVLAGKIVRIINDSAAPALQGVRSVLEEHSIELTPEQEIQLMLRIQCYTLLWALKMLDGVISESEVKTLNVSVFSAHASFLVLDNSAALKDVIEFSDACHNDEDFLKYPSTACFSILKKEKLLSIAFEMDMAVNHHLPNLQGSLLELFPNKIKTQRIA